MGYGDDYQPSERCYEWNRAYFSAALNAEIAVGPGGNCLSIMDLLSQLPESRRLAAIAAVMRELDQIWLGDNSIADVDAVSLRELLVQQILATSQWKHAAERPSHGMAYDATEAFAAMFFNEYLVPGSLRCYILPLGMGRAKACLPLLVAAAEQAGGSTFVALAILGLLETDPQSGDLPYLTRLVASWHARIGANDDFWINYGIASRVCNWIDRGVLASEVDLEVLNGADLMMITDILLQCGGPTARALDDRVSIRRSASH